MFSPPDGELPAGLNEREVQPAIISCASNPVAESVSKVLPTQQPLAAELSADAVKVSSQTELQPAPDQIVQRQEPSDTENRAELAEPVTHDVKDPTDADDEVYEVGNPQSEGNLSYKTIAHALGNLQQQVIHKKTQASPYSDELAKILKQDEPEGTVYVAKPEFKPVQKPQNDEREAVRSRLADCADEVLGYIAGLKRYLENKETIYRKSGQQQLKHVVQDTEALIDAFITGQTPVKSADVSAEEQGARQEEAFSLSSETLPQSNEDKLLEFQQAALEQDSWFEEQREQPQPAETASQGDLLQNPFAEAPKDRALYSEDGDLNPDFADEEADAEDEYESIPDPEQNYALTSSDEHVHITELEPEHAPLEDGNPQAVSEAKRKALEAYSKAQMRPQLKLGRSLGPEDFFSELSRNDPWYKDIVDAGYTEDSIHSALTYSSRTIDPEDAHHWILTMSQDFALFIQDPQFLHNITTKFSFMHRHPLKIDIVPYNASSQENYPADCPYAKALQALFSAVGKAKQELFKSPALQDFFLSQGQNSDSIELILLKQSPLLQDEKKAGS